MSERIYLKKESMEDDCMYLCDARNFRIGIWHCGAMYGVRRKFGDIYVDCELHMDDGPENRGTCLPLKRISGKLVRLQDWMFSPSNWRGQLVLEDMLSAVEALELDELRVDL